MNQNKEDPRYFINHISVARRIVVYLFNRCCCSKPISYLFTLTLTFCLTFPFLTNITNSCTLAIPFPCLLVSVISTSYSLPTSTGFGAGEPLSKPLFPPPP